MYALTVNEAQSVAGGDAYTVVGDILGSAEGVEAASAVGAILEGAGYGSVAGPLGAIAGAAAAYGIYELIKVTD